MGAEGVVEKGGDELGAVEEGDELLGALLVTASKNSENLEEVWRQVGPLLLTNVMRVWLTSFSERQEIVKAPFPLKTETSLPESKSLKKRITTILLPPLPPMP